MKRNHILALLSILCFFSNSRLYSQVQPQFIAALGSGNVPPQTIGRYTPWHSDGAGTMRTGVGSIDQLAYKDKKNPMSTELYLKFGSFKLTYKIWSMLGEPVFDFLFRWDGLIGIGNVFFEEAKQWGLSSENQEEISKMSELRNFDKDLQERLKNISPLSVRFRISISNKSFHIDAREVEIKELRYIDSRGFSKRGLQAQNENKDTVFLGLSETVFSIDLPNSEGKWQTHSVPGSPNWDQLPSYFKTVLKNRENPADLFINDIQIVDIRWPQYELKSIIREQYLRILTKQNETHISSSDFWDKTPSKGNLPPPQIPESQRGKDIRDTQLVAEERKAQGRYAELYSSTGSLVRAEETGLNVLKLHLAKVLGGSVVVMKDASGKEIGRQNITPGSATATINIPQKLDRIELFKDWEYIGSLKYAYKENMPGVGSIRGEILVQGGTFRMGNDHSYSGEKPAHSVTVSGFWMMKTEVTQRDYISLIGVNPSAFKGDDLPVAEVSWFDAVAYANKLSERDGLRLAYRINGTNVEWDRSADGWRLPTEAEWEYAARGGALSRGFTYAGGNDLGSVGWYSDNSRGRQPVGKKVPNELGLYDMSGNVMEWCWDWREWYTGVAQTDPSGAASGTDRIVRGGGVGTGEWGLTVTYRHNDAPGDRHSFIGFRLVRSLR